MTRGVAWVLVMVSAAAFGHGLAAGTTSVSMRVGSSTDLFVGTSFGPLVSRNGEAFRLICAEGIGYDEGYETVLHWGAAGRMVVANAAGAFTSTDGCTWTESAELANEGVNDLFFEQTSQVLYASTGRYGGQNGVWRSLDHGGSFTLSALTDGSQYFTGVRSSGALPNRLYASAWWYLPVASTLFVSEDAGLTWTNANATLPAVGPFFVLGVSPTAPNIVFAWMSADSGELLLRSTDAGASFQTVLTADGARRGLTFSPDGNTVWVASQRRLYRSTDGGATFTALPLPTTNACVQRAGSDLYACGGRLDGWALGRSTDGGDTFDKVLTLDQVAGVETCTAGTPIHDVCEPLWSVTRVELAQAAAPPPLELTASTGGVQCAAGVGLWPGAMALGALLLTLPRRQRGRKIRALSKR